MGMVQLTPPGQSPRRWRGAVVRDAVDAADATRGSPRPRSPPLGGGTGLGARQQPRPKTSRRQSPTERAPRVFGLRRRFGTVPWHARSDPKRPKSVRPSWTWGGARSSRLPAAAGAMWPGAEPRRLGPGCHGPRLGACPGGGARCASRGYESAPCVCQPIACGRCHGAAVSGGGARRRGGRESDRRDAARGERHGQEPAHRRPSRRG